MLVIRCTQKLLKERSIDASALDEPASEGIFGSWFAHLLIIDRRKCVLFTHGSTLYSFLVPGVRKADLARFEQVVLSHLLQSLQAEGINGAVRARLESEARHVVLARTNNRSVLGSMNDLALQCKATIAAGRIENCDVAELNQRLNRIPMRAISYRYAIEQFKEHLRQVLG